MNIQHWEQYLTPLGKTKLNLHPESFDNVLKWDSIILPVFQRKYCWTTTQLSRYWNDLLYIALNMGDSGHRRHRRRHDNAHSLGKIITFEETVNDSIKKITVIDGQQRLTSTILILTAMYHLLSELKKDNKDNKDEKEIETNKNIRKKIEKIMFLQKPSIVKKLDYSEGDSLHQYVRFIPTFLDRFYFYNVLLKPKSCIVSKMEKEEKKGNDSNNDSNKDSNGEIKVLPNSSNDVLSDIMNPNFNHFYNAFNYFYNELKRFINDSVKIKLLFANLLTQFKFIYVGIPHEAVNVSQQHSIYQWFFERELFIEQAGGDRPGYSQTVCDLFRNYLLSFFITNNMNQQKRIYKLWLNTETSYQNVIEYNKYLIDTIKISHNAPYKPYDFYRKFVDLIEMKLKQYNKADYSLFMESLLSNLNENKEYNCYSSLIYGYLKKSMIEMNGINNNEFEQRYGNITKVTLNYLYDRSDLFVNTIDYTHLQLAHIHIANNSFNNDKEKKIVETTMAKLNSNQANNDESQTSNDMNDNTSVIDMSNARKLSEITEDASGDDNW